MANKKLINFKSQLFFQQIIDQFFDSEEINTISKAIDKCYLNANTGIAGSSLMGLNCPAGKKIRPFIFYAEIEAYIDKLCKQGLLSCKSEWKTIPQNGDTYLVLTKIIKGFKVQATINQTKNSSDVSRPAECRKALNQNGQLSLFEDESELNSSTIYLELNHGYQGSKPQFIILGLPTENNEWVVKKALPLVGYTSTIKDDTLNSWDKHSVPTFTNDEMFNNSDKDSKTNR